MIIILFGPEASGKMTIGQELTKNSNFKLLYNHQIIDLVGTIYDKEHIGTNWEFKQHHIDLISKMYELFLKNAIDNKENLIVTITWNFNNYAMKEFFLKMEKYAKEHNEKMLFIELYTTMEERLRRNKTPNRLEHKVCKRDIKNSNKHLINATNDLKLNSTNEMEDFENYLFFNNTNMLPIEVSKKILTHIIENML